MKKTILYGAIVLALIPVPVKRADVGKMLPVQLFAIEQSEESYQIRTELGNEGKGRSLEEAFRNLQQESSGYLYPDTARYVMVKGNVRELVDQLRRRQNQKVWICEYEGKIPLKDALKYLTVHRPEMRIGGKEAKGKLVSLIKTEKGFRYD